MEKEEYFMQKLFIGLIIINSVVLLSACTSGWSRAAMLSLDDTKKEMTIQFEEIVEALNNEDKEALKIKFSEQTIKEEEDFDENIESLYNFIQGDIVSWEKIVGAGTSESIDRGEKVKDVNSYFYVNTDDEKYYFLLDTRLIDTANPDKVGISLLLVVRAVDREKIYDDSQKILFDGDEELQRTGIYIPLP